MIYNNLDRKIMTAWWIKRLIRFIVILVIIIILYKVISRQDFYKFIAPYFYPVVIFILTYQIISLILYPILEYRQWGYLISNDRVEIKHGIIYIVTTVIPIIRIQHVTIENGPILRILGLSMVNINTASGAFVIEGLSNEEAMSITEALKNKLYTRLEQQTKE